MINVEKLTHTKIVVDAPGSHLEVAADNYVTDYPDHVSLKFNFVDGAGNQTTIEFFGLDMEQLSDIAKQCQLAIRRERAAIARAEEEVAA